MPETLLTFRAGRSFRRRDTNFVDASDVKGAVEIARGDDELLHFRWRNRVTGAIEDDLIMFPSDAQFVKAAGRTYVLKFSSSGQCHFFWMQDASSVEDDMLVFHVNGYLTDPDYDRNVASGSIRPQEQNQAGTSASALQSSIPGVTQEQLDQLRAFLEQQSSRDQSAAGLPDLSLTDVLTPANLKPLFEDPILLASFLPHLPPDLPGEASPSEETLQRIIDSSQFQDGVRNLDQALNTGLLGGFVKSLGLPEEAGLGVGPFLKAIADQARLSRSAGEKMDTE